MISFMQKTFQSPNCSYCKEPTTPAIAGRVGCACEELWHALEEGKYLKTAKWVDKGANISQRASPSDLRIARTWSLALTMLQPTSRDVKTPLVILDTINAFNTDNVEILIAALIKGHTISADELTTARTICNNSKTSKSTCGVGLDKQQFNARVNLLTLINKLVTLKEQKDITDEDIHVILTLLTSIDKDRDNDQARSADLKKLVIAALVCFETENGRSVAIKHFIKDISDDVIETVISSAREHQHLPELLVALIANTINSSDNAATLIEKLRKFLPKDQKAVEEALELSNKHDYRVAGALLDLLGKTPQEIADWFEPQLPGTEHSIQ